MTLNLRIGARSSYNVTYSQPHNQENRRVSVYCWEEANFIGPTTDFRALTIQKHRHDTAPGVPRTVPSPCSNDRCHQMLQCQFDAPLKLQPSHWHHLHQTTLRSQKLVVSSLSGSLLAASLRTLKNRTYLLAPAKP